MSYPKLKYKDFPNDGMIEIEGIKYDHAIFQGLACSFPIGAIFKIIERGKGNVSVERLFELEEK